MADMISYSYEERNKRKKWNKDIIEIKVSYKLWLWVKYEPDSIWVTFQFEEQYKHLSCMMCWWWEHRVSIHYPISIFSRWVLHISLSPPFHLLFSFTFPFPLYTLILLPPFAFTIAHHASPSPSPSPFQLNLSLFPFPFWSMIPSQFLLLFPLTIFSYYFLSLLPLYHNLSL